MFFIKLHAKNMKKHQYKVELNWTGNQGEGTAKYNAYNRNHTMTGFGKEQDLLLSSDPSFLGDKQRYNPEELLLTSLASCHMLWYLHLCATNGVIVVDYADNPIGEMIENPNGSGQFSEVVLYPKVKIKNAHNIALATELHQRANEMCFIARSCNFPVKHSVEILV